MPPSGAREVRAGPVLLVDRERHAVLDLIGRVAGQNAQVVRANVEVLVASMDAAGRGGALQALGVGVGIVVEPVAHDVHDGVARRLRAVQLLLQAEACAQGRSGATADVAGRAGCTDEALATHQLLLREVHGLALAVRGEAMQRDGQAAALRRLRKPRRPRRGGPPAPAAPMPWAAAAGAGAGTELEPGGDEAISTQALVHRRPSGLPRT